MNDTKLTVEELSKISLGYNWNQEMSSEDFWKENKKLSRQEAFQIYETINCRYIHYKYEMK